MGETLSRDDARDSESRVNLDLVIHWFLLIHSLLLNGQSGGIRKWLLMHK